MVQKAYQICTHTYLTIKQNLFWAFAYNIIAIPLASMGYLNPIFAEVTMRAENEIKLSGSTALQIQKLLDVIEAIDDVQNVYTNFVINQE